MWARASALDRHLECPASSYYPRDENGEWVKGYLQSEKDFVVPFEDNVEDNIFAEWGNEMHKAKESAEDASPIFLSRVSPHRDRLWPASLGVHEITVKYNCKTGIATQGPSDRAKAGAWKKFAGPDEITGTADWSGNLPKGDLWIDDLKTGYKTPDPCSNQLKFYALCIFKIKGLAKTPLATVRLSATHWRRDWDEPRRYWTQITWPQLEEFETRLRDSWRTTIGHKGKTPVQGLHCNYCPSLMVCSAVNGIDYERIGENEL